MSIFFAVDAIIAFVMAIVHKNPYLILLGGIFIMVAYIAYDDYKNPQL
jgi:predicted tellurium resistance membrane protein TerC